MKTFGNITIGIHGKELPKFADKKNTHEYWKHFKSYKENPQFKSSLEMRQAKRYWATPDKMRLNDVQETPPPPDPFKATFVLPIHKNKVEGKVNEAYQFTGEPKDSLITKIRPRWTEFIHNIQQKKSVYDDNTSNKEYIKSIEERPLPSSFTKSGIFIDPLVVKPK